MSGQAPPFPSRAERKACWGARDAYYACLDAKDVSEPGTEQGACDPAMKAYGGSCAKSWVEYFNKRRVLEAELRARLVAEETRGTDVSGIRYGPADPKKSYSGRG